MIFSRRQVLQWASAAGLGSVIASYGLPAHSQDPDLLNCIKDLIDQRVDPNTSFDRCKEGLNAPTQESLVSETTGIDYADLDQALKNRDWREADQLTHDLMVQAADRIEEGYLNEESIDNFPGEDLKLIDRLWVEHSNGTLGFSVQKRIWREVGSPGPDYDSNRSAWTRFGERVNWQGGSGWHGWRFYRELDFTDPQKIPGHLPAQKRFRYNLVGLFSREEI